MMAMRWGHLLFTAVVGGSRRRDAQQARSVSAAKRVDSVAHRVSIHTREQLTSRTDSVTAQNASRENGDTSSRGSVRLGFVRSGGGARGGGWRGWRGGWFLMGVRDRSTNAAPSSCVATGDGRWRLGGNWGAGEAEATPGGDLKMGPGAATTCDWSLCRLAEAFVFPRLLGRPASVRRSLCLCSVLPGDGCDNTPAQATSSLGLDPCSSSSSRLHLTTTRPPTMTANAIGLRMCF